MMDMEEKEIRHFDSMGGDSSYILNTLLKYLIAECKDKLERDLEREKWRLRDMRDSIPQQNNCWDCGVFTCANAILSCLKMVSICGYV